MSIDDLPDKATVIRGGPMTAANVIRRARKDQWRLGLLGISAFAGSSPETTVAELVEVGEIPHAVLNMLCSTDPLWVGSEERDSSSAGSAGGPIAPLTWATTQTRMRQPGS